MTPTRNYKGLGVGPVSRKLADSRMSKPTVLRQAGRALPQTPNSYHPPSGGHGGVSLHSLLAQQHAAERQDTRQTIQGAKAGQGLDVAAQQLDLIEQAMQRMGLHDDEGGATWDQSTGQ